MELELPGGHKISAPTGVRFFYLADIITWFLPYLFVIAGLILFGAIIASGFQLLTSAGNPESTKKAQGCLTHAVIGFVIIFLSYWLIQIIQIIFHIDVLG